MYKLFPYTEIQLKWLKVLENRDRGFRPKQVIGALQCVDCTDIFDYEFNRARYFE